MNLRGLEQHLRAWESFREVAHAARTLAATQSVRWAQYRDTAREHLERVEQSTTGLDLPISDDLPAVVVAYGSDLGLCGALNRTVAAALDEHLASHPASVLIIVGYRLLELLGDRNAIALPAASSFPAAETQAETIERLVAAATPVGAPPIYLVLATRTDPTGSVTVRVLGPRPPVTADVPAARWLSPTEQAMPLLHDLWLRARLVAAACNAAHTEAQARLALMTHAHGAADRRIEVQSRKLRSLRQEMITQEMLETLSGIRSARARHVTTTRRRDGQAS